MSVYFNELKLIIRNNDGLVYFNDAMPPTTTTTSTTTTSFSPIYYTDFDFSCSIGYKEVGGGSGYYEAASVSASTLFWNFAWPFYSYAEASNPPYWVDMPNSVTGSTTLNIVPVDNGDGTYYIAIRDKYDISNVTIHSFIVTGCPTGSTTTTTTTSSSTTTTTTTSSSTTTTTTTTGSPIYYTSSPASCGIMYSIVTGGNGAYQCATISGDTFYNFAWPYTSYAEASNPSYWNDIPNTATTNYVGVESGNGTYYIAIRNKYNISDVNIQSIVVGGCPEYHSGYTIGTSVDGGVVAYVFLPGDIGYLTGKTSGIIVATDDITSGTTTGFTWGCNSLSITGLTTALHFGLTNTNKIISACSGVSAARLASAYTDGIYNDWFLGSLNDMIKVDTNRSVLPNFTELGHYWCSNQTNVIEAYSLWFNGVYSYNSDYKTTLNRIRPIRYFSVLN